MSEFLIAQQKPAMKIKVLVIDHWDKIISLRHIPIFISLMDKSSAWRNMTDYDTQATDWQSFLNNNRKQEPPDIVILYFNHSLFDTRYADSYSLWEKIINLWAELPFFILVNGEPINPKKGLFDFSISFLSNTENNITFNMFLTDYYIMPMLHSELNAATSFSIYPPEYVKLAYKLRNKFTANKKDKFCNFIYRNDNSDYNRVVERIELCKKINGYKKVDCAGPLMNNTNSLINIQKNEEILEEQGIYKEPLHMPPAPGFREYCKCKYISSYKFTIAGENTDTPNYITEKIIHPLFVGSIPIYIGTKDITKFVNPKAFINCRDFASFDEVVERVKEIDQSPKLYQEYLTQPVFLPDSDIYQYSKDKIADRMRPLTTIIKELYDEKLSLNKSLTRRLFRISMKFFREKVNKSSTDKTKSLIREMLESN